MLSSEWYQRYESVHKGMLDSVEGTMLPYRLTETNNMWYGGLQDASDTFASALWCVDYLYWWAEAGARGLNFHTGNRVGGGDTTLQSRYTAFVTNDQGLDVRPLSYGMTLFNLGGHGRMIPVAVTSANGQKLSVYATLSDDKTVSVTLINKEHGAGAPATKIELLLAAPSKATDAQVLFLTVPRGDIAAKTGITLGGKPIRESGRWSGKWMPLNIRASDSSITLTVPPASAAIVRVHMGSSPVHNRLRY
jgi:hypothetical protein